MRFLRNALPPLLVIAAFVVSAVAYPHLPAMVPTHWGLSGQPDGYSSRLHGALLLPAVMLIVWLVLIIAPKYNRGIFIRYRARQSDESTERPIYPLIVTLILAALLGIHAFGIGSAVGWVAPSESPVLLTIIISVLMLVLGNYMPRVTQRNAFIGFRVPWAYASEEVWRRTQRAAGYGMVAAGVVGLLAAALAPARCATVLMSVILIQLAAVALYSYRIALSREVP